MIVLVHENHDKWPNVTPVQDFCRGFDHANLVSSFLGSNYLPKNYLNNIRSCVFFRKQALEKFYLKK